MDFLLRAEAVSAALMRQKQLEQAAAANSALLSSLGHSPPPSPPPNAHHITPPSFGVPPLGLGFSSGRQDSLSSLLKLAATAGIPAPQGPPRSQAPSASSQVPHSDVLSSKLNPTALLDALAQRDPVTRRSPLLASAGSPSSTMLSQGLSALRADSAALGAFFESLQLRSNLAPASSDIGWSPRTEPATAAVPQEESSKAPQVSDPASSPTASPSKKSPTLLPKASENDSSTGPKRKTKREHFPERLMRILQEVDQDKSLYGIVRFSTKGTIVEVQNVDAFESSILARYFNHGSICSFKRQLHIYGFQRLRTSKPNTLQFQHPDFRRGEPQRCILMERVNKPGNMNKRNNTKQHVAS